MKRSKLLLVAGLLGLVYFIYLITYFGNGIMSAETTTENVSAGIATALVAPHMICVGIAVLFNCIGWAMNVRWAALVAGIMYAVSMLCFFLYAMFVLVQMILCFVGFSKMKKVKEKIE